MSEPKPSHQRWQRFFNGFIYNAGVPLYTSMDWVTLGARWRRMRRALPHVPPNSRVLEVGFGPGKLHKHLAEDAQLLAGIDMAWGMCRTAKQRLQQAGLESYITRASALNLPYAEAQFDAVVSTFSFCAFPSAIDAMNEMVRVTVPSGCVVLVDIGLPNDGNRYGTFWGRLWERMGHYMYDIPAIMDAAGLEVTTFEEFGPGQHMRTVVGEKLA